MNQADFGQLLDSSQGAVSAWERDDKERSPSAAIYFHLAALAHSAEDSLFFLEQAGLKPDAVISVANVLLKEGKVNMGAILATTEDLLKERLGDQKQRMTEGKDVLVPPFKGTEPVPFDVTVPASRVSNLSSTFYEIVGTKSVYGRAGHGVGAGDILVLDKREIPSYDEILAQRAVVEFEDGPFVGQFAYVSDGTTRHLAFGPFDGTPGGFSFGVTPDLRVISSHHSDLGVPTNRQSHEIRRYMGLLLAQYPAEVAAEWKRAAEQHKPTIKVVRGTVRRA